MGHDRHNCAGLFLHGELPLEGPVFSSEPGEELSHPFPVLFCEELDSGKSRLHLFSLVARNRDREVTDEGEKVELIHFEHDFG